MNFIQAAQELGITLASEDLERVVAAMHNAFNAGLKDGATFERRKHQADIEAWKAEAATAERWRGMALAKDPMQPGKAVQEIQREAMEREREACAKLADAQLRNTSMLMSFPPKSGAAWEIAAAIRARGQSPAQNCCKGGPQWGHAWDCKELP